MEQIVRNVDVTEVSVKDVMRAKERSFMYRMEKPVLFMSVQLIRINSHIVEHAKMSHVISGEIREIRNSPMKNLRRI